MSAQKAVPNETVAVLDALLDRLDKLHSSPAVALRVLQLTRDADYRVSDVVECIEHDPPLTAAVLRLVNSSFYGVAREIASVHDAINYLGRHALRLAALGFGLVQSMSAGAPALFQQHYWKRSLTIGVAARKLVRRAGLHDLAPDVAFTGGLLADVGALALAQLDGQDYVPMFLHTEHASDLPQREFDAYGFDHGAIGARLLSRWNLPGDLCQAVAAHHGCPPTAPALPQVLAAATLLNEALWTPESPHMGNLGRLLRSRFALDTDDLIALAMECQTSVSESAALFQIRLGEEIDVAAVEREARRLAEYAAFENAADLDSVEAMILNAGGGARD